MLVALFIVFCGWRAGLMPLAVAAIAVLGSFAVLSLLASVIEVSIFAVNLTTALARVRTGAMRSIREERSQMGP